MSSNSMDSLRKLHAIPFDYIGRNGDSILFFPFLMHGILCITFLPCFVNNDSVAERLKMKWYEIIAKNIAMEYSI